MKNVSNRTRTRSRLLSTIFMLFLSIGVFAQQITVKGIVKDETGESIIGASVLVKGTTNGTITDFDGNFTLTKVDRNSDIVISYVGYLGQTVKAAANLNITLKEDSKTLDDVVVIGYGVQKKSVVTASIAKVGEDVLAQTAPVRMDNALKGLAAGVQVATKNGQPGTGNIIRVRGIGTVNNSDPLYIVDGMVVEGGLDNINPADIASIEVLKDAASGAVYGARAANGVILVTTKKGAMGRVKVSYDFSYGWQSAWRKRKMLNASQYATLMNEACDDAGIEHRFANTNLGAGTDWQDVLFNDGAPVMNHQLTVSGASEKINYYFSAGYFTQDGIIGGDYNRSNYDRMSFRSNTIYTLFDESKNRNWLKKMTVGLNATYSRIHSIGVTAGNLTGSPLGDALFMDPTMEVYANSIEDLNQAPGAGWDAYEGPTYDAKTGKLLQIPTGDFNELANPLARMSAQPGTKNNSDKLLATLTAELNIWDNLTYKFSWGSDLAFWGSDSWEHPYYLDKSNLNTNSSASSSMNRGYRWQIENILTYNKTIGQHSFDIVLGQSAQRYTSRALWGQGYDLIEHRGDKASINFTTGLASDGKRNATGGPGDPNSLASYFGRFSYNFAERYMLQATVRRDGSSRFGPNNKWGTFPSVSVGWNLTNEPFMEKRPEWWTNTKVRLSWGKNGNENITNFLYTANVATGNNYPFGGYGSGQHIVLGSKPTVTPNADLKWEESEQWDAGLDFGFFGNALTFTVDYYYKKTNGMLKEMPIPSYLGESLPWGNVGSMKNWGWEFELGYKHQSGDFRYGITANASYQQNELINLGNASGFDTSDNVHQIGNVSCAQNGFTYPFFYGYKTNGIIQNQAEADAYNSKYNQQAVPGDVRFVDFNEDGQLSDADKTMIGKGYADWTFGINLTAAYKNFDFSMLFSGSLGVDILDVTRRLDLDWVNLPEEFMNRWHGEGTSTTMPRFTFPGKDSNNNWRISDLYVKNGNYARIKNIQLGYTLPNKLTRKFMVDRLRLYVAAENLLTLTSYKGLDPEMADGSQSSVGIDRGYYPQARTYTVGLNLTF